MRMRIGVYIHRSGRLSLVDCEWFGERSDEFNRSTLALDVHIELGEGGYFLMKVLMCKM